jgi:tRNA (guanine37-N1)-methyltransferase
LNFYVLTLFPKIIEDYFQTSLVDKAVKQRIINYQAINIRDFSRDKHKRCDDMPYGGGSGMVMTLPPIVAALESINIAPQHSVKKILLTPQGRVFKQNVAEELATYENLVFICGRYEGVDYRITNFVDDEISLGDFILSGGETAALAMIDATVRLVPGVIGNPNSLNEESFAQNLLEYPQYTRPQNFRGLEVPEVLLNGHHKQIYEWRKQQSQILTARKRQDLPKSNYTRGDKNGTRK